MGIPEGSEDKLKETLRHKDAFEYYYSLGSGRSYYAMAIKLGVSKSTIGKWGRAFHWQERVEQRDIEIGKKLPAKTNETVIAIKANYRAEIKNQFNILKKMLDELKKEGIKIKDATGLKDVLGCYEKLIKMDLTLIGEVSGREEIVLRDAEEKFFNEINSLVARERKTKNIRKNKKSKR